MELVKDFDKTGQLVAGGPPVGDEHIDLLAQNGHLNVVDVLAVLQRLPQLQPVDRIDNSAHRFHLKRRGRGEIIMGREEEG